MPNEKVTMIHVPQHNENSELKSFIFHDEDYEIDIIGDTCQIGPSSKMEMLTDDSSYTASMSAPNMESNHRQLALVKSELTVDQLPAIVQDYCIGKKLIEIEAVIDKTELTFEEYEKSRVTNGMHKRHRRGEMLNCERQCELNADVMYALPFLPEPLRSQQLQVAINTSFGFACTHHEYGTCNGRSVCLVCNFAFVSNYIWTVIPERFLVISS